LSAGFVGVYSPQMVDPPATTSPGIGDTTLTYEKNGSPVIEESHVELVVASGPDADRTEILPAGGIVVGTGPSAGMRLTDPSISRRHVELTPVEDGILVKDLGSTNGTRAGGSRIAEAVVPLGTVLVLGKTEIDTARVVERHPLPLSRRRRFGDLLGSSAAMRQVYALLERASEVDVTVLIEGETGTGKELAARALHANSSRSHEPFHIVDCGAVSPTLIEAELFGHVKGAFTGADRDRPGAFELANRGTLLFDEIGELPLGLQPKLLRALESREIRRIGGTARIPVDVRFAAATNRKLADEVKRGRFREDLFYRLNVFRITMPPLREHREDIPTYVEHYLAPQGGSALSEEFVARMKQLDWPGNVRELRNAVERAVVLARGGPPSSLPDEATAPADPAEDAARAVDVSRPFKEVKAEMVAEFERRYLEEALKESSGNISAAARNSGIDRKHMERLIRKHRIKAR